MGQDIGGGVAAPRAPASAPVGAQAPAPSPRKKGRGCFATGCLLVLALLLFGVAAAAAIYFRVPQQIGLLPSADRLLEGTPDRAASAEIAGDMQAAGVDTTGLTLYVLPVKDASGTLAYAILDVSEGFQFPSGGESNPLFRVMTALVESPAIDRANVTQIAVEYRDGSGHRLGTFTAKTAVVRQLANGQLDDQAFSEQLAGDVDPAAALGSGASASGAPEATP